VYRQLLEPGSASSRPISEKGVLQLLLDVRLLRDALAGGRPHGAGSSGGGGAGGGAAAAPGTPGSPAGRQPLFDHDPEVANALAARRREAGALEVMLQDRCGGCGRARGRFGAGAGQVWGAVSWGVAVLGARCPGPDHSRVRPAAGPAPHLPLTCPSGPAPPLSSPPPRRLDPIDWATYEPYLWTNVQKYYQRVAVLLGTLIQLHRVHPEAPGRCAAPAPWPRCLAAADSHHQLSTTTSTPSPSPPTTNHRPPPTAHRPRRSFASQDSNPLNVARVAPRFQYLPISAPTAASAAAGRAKAPGGLSAGLARTATAAPGPAAAAAAAAATSDLGGTYSFADLGVGRASGGAGGAEQGQGQDFGAGGSAFSALQARLQGGVGTGLGSLGLMLGDKAAEMTAMAQQRFETIGDYLPTGGLGTGLLSSFAKTVAAKK
jgi:hypothetical protein